jgi:hypothetical protein
MKKKKKKRTGLLIREIVPGTIVCSSTLAALAVSVRVEGGQRYVSWLTTSCSNPMCHTFYMDSVAPFSADVWTFQALPPLGPTGCGHVEPQFGAQEGATVAQ